MSYTEVNCIKIYIEFNCMKHTHHVSVGASNFFKSGCLLFIRSILNCFWYLFHVPMHWYLTDFFSVNVCVNFWYKSTVFKCGARSMGMLRPC